MGDEWVRMGLLAAVVTVMFVIVMLPKKGSDSSKGENEKEE